MKALRHSAPAGWRAAPNPIYWRILVTVLAVVAFLPCALGSLAMGTRLPSAR